MDSALNDAFEMSNTIALCPLVEAHTTNAPALSAASVGVITA